MMPDTHPPSSSAMYHITHRVPVLGTPAGAGGARQPGKSAPPHVSTRFTRISLDRSLVHWSQKEQKGVSFSRPSSPLSATSIGFEKKKTSCSAKPRELYDASIRSSRLFRIHFHFLGQQVLLPSSTSSARFTSTQTLPPPFLL